MNHVLTSHTMQMIYDPTMHKSFEIENQRRPWNADGCRHDGGGGQK